MKKKLLIICPSMWPRLNTWGETQRMYYLANHLSKNGWDVYTVSPGFEYREGTKREQFYSSIFKGNFQPEVLKQKQTNSAATKKTYGLRVYKTITKVLIPVVNWLYNEPNCTQGPKMQFWRLKYQNDILQLILEKNIDKVLISVPAFSLMGFGKIIRHSFPKAKIIYDYRDPWYLWNKKKNYAWYTEKKNLRYADYIIGFSEIFSKELSAEMGIRADKIDTIYNGYSEADWKRYEAEISLEQHSIDKMRLVYTGNIAISDKKENFRNVSALMQAVKQLPDIELYLVGVNDHHAGTTDGNIHFIGNVSQKESFHYMKTADVLLSIHDTTDCSGKYLVSGKFYDYMRSGKVIWHIGTPDSLMTNWIQQYGLGVSCCNKQEELQKILLLLHSYWEKGSLNTLRTCDWEAIRKFSREYQNTKYESFLRSIDK